MECCLFIAFPNSHCVCHETTIMHEPISKFGDSNHGSPVFLRFGYPVVNSLTHSPKSLDHFLLTENDKPFCLDQCNVHYVTSGGCNVLTMGNNKTTNPPYNVMT